MGQWSIIVPAVATNECVNPSAEIDASGFSGVSSLETVTRSSDRSLYGSYSVKCVCTANGDGVFVAAITASGTYFVSANVYAATGETVAVYAWTSTSDSALIGTITGNDGWQKISAQITATSNVAIDFRSTSGAQTFYVDGVQYCTVDSTYIDGDQPGCEWLAGDHVSASERTSQSRDGGIEYDLSDYGITVNGMTQFGVGMPPIANNIIKPANSDIAQYTGYSVLPRDFSLSISAVGDSLDDLHSIREAIIDAIKPDLTGKPQPFWLRYTNIAGTKTLGIRCIYSGGLEGVPASGYTEAADIRLACVDPFWYEDGNGAAPLTVVYDTGSVDYTMARIDNVWDRMAGMTGTVYAITSDSAGKIYAGGDFLSANSVSDASYVAVWDGSDWSELPGATPPNGAVYALAVGPDGSLYVGGNFTSVGGVSDTAYIAKYTVGVPWTALGTGANGAVRALKFGMDGKLYAGGDFTSMGGVSDTAYIAAWDGSAWSALGTGGDDAVLALETGLDGSLYAGGDFTSMGGVSDTLHIAKWDGSAWSAMLSGSGAAVRALRQARNGLLYVAAIVGYDLSPYIAAWNGSTFQQLGSGLDALVYSIDIDDDGLVYVGGAFTTAGGISLADRCAIWNGYSWVHLPVNFAGTPVVNVIYVHKKNIYIGHT